MRNVSCQDTPALLTPSIHFPHSSGNRESPLPGAALKHIHSCPTPPVPTDTSAGSVSLCHCHQDSLLCPISSCTGTWSQPCPSTAEPPQDMAGADRGDNEHISLSALFYSRGARILSSILQMGRRQTNEINPQVTAISVPSVCC